MDVTQSVAVVVVPVVRGLIIYDTTLSVEEHLHNVQRALSKLLLEKAKSFGGVCVLPDLGAGMKGLEPGRI